ncbi:hypothetical protein Tco_0379305 [Tanacetum coccineum]
MNSNDLSDIYEYHTQLDMEQYTQYLEYFEQYEAMEEDEAESSVKHTRRYIARDRELAEDKLWRDYFGDENTPPVYPEEYFRRRLTFMLDKKMLSLTLDDFITIFHLPQATDNNHDSFVPPPSFLDMVPFYKNELGFTMELKTSSSFKTTGLPQPWKTLCKIFSKCLTTHVTGWDQPPLQIMQMMKTQRQSWNEDSWMISDELKHTEHYRMYAEVFGIDVPLTQSQPTERSIRLTPPDPVPTVDKADEMILEDTLQVSLAEHKSREEQEARDNVELVNKHLASEEIENMVDEPENVIDDSLIPRNDDQNIPARWSGQNTNTRVFNATALSGDVGVKNGVFTPEGEKKVHMMSKKDLENNCEEKIKVVLK